MTAKTLRVFCSTIPSVNFIMPNGKPIIFQGGRYYTDVPEEISALEAEVASRHPHIFIDKDQLEIPAEDLNPAIAMKKKIVGTLSREELLAALAATERAATDPSNDFGSSAQAPVRPANTRDVASVAAGGTTEVRVTAVPKK